MIITANTKISALIKANPDVIDVITSINAHFKKLQNPVLRKILASRVTIADAARIGKCDIETFFLKLKPLGFTVLGLAEARAEYGSVEQDSYEKVPGNIHYDVLLDVREDISSGKDPFRKIMQAVSTLSKGNVLLIINTFEPLPLISILQEKGFTADVVEIASDEVHTYFRKVVDNEITIEHGAVDEMQFNRIAARFNDRLQYIDVRQLPMPQPMITILKTLEALPGDMALFVYHKKVPLFLLPELKERKFEAVIRHTAEGVELIIYKQGDDE